MVLVQILIFILFLYNQFYIVSSGNLNLNINNDNDLHDLEDEILQSLRFLDYKNPLKNYNRKFITPFDDFEDEILQSLRFLDYKNPLKNYNRKFITPFDDFEDHPYSSDKPKKQYKIQYQNHKNNYKEKEQKNDDECFFVCNPKITDIKDLFLAKILKKYPSIPISNAQVGSKKEERTRKTSLKQPKTEKMKTKEEIELEIAIERLKKLNVKIITEENKNEMGIIQECQPANIDICYGIANIGSLYRKSTFNSVKICCCEIAKEELDDDFCHSYHNCIKNKTCSQELQTNDEARISFGYLKGD